jgi:hypothetical protein
VWFVALREVRRMLGSQTIERLTRKLRKSAASHGFQLV